jgi:hypothetical protein
MYCGARSGELSIEAATAESTEMISTLQRVVDNGVEDYN